MMKPSDEWVDAYIDSHPDSCIEDAERAWWDLQVEQDPEVGKLTAEQEKVSKELRKGRAVDAYGKERKRERKPDEEKRELIRRLVEALADLSPEVVNPEREIRFGSYSVTLTRHRTPKG